MCDENARNRMSRQAGLTIIGNITTTSELDKLLDKSISLKEVKHHHYDDPSADSYAANVTNASAHNAYFHCARSSILRNFNGAKCSSAEEAKPWRAETGAFTISYQTSYNKITTTKQTCK